MLQSDKHHDLIEQELEAFLQEHSRPFVTWLRQQLEAVAGRRPSGIVKEGIGKTSGADDAAGVAVAHRKNVSDETTASTTGRKGSASPPVQGESPPRPRPSARLSPRRLSPQRSPRRGPRSRSPRRERR